MITPTVTDAGSPTIATKLKDASTATTTIALASDVSKNVLRQQTIGHKLEDTVAQCKPVAGENLQTRVEQEEELRDSSTATTTIAPTSDLSKKVLPQQTIGHQWVDTAELSPTPTSSNGKQPVSTSIPTEDDATDASQEMEGLEKEEVHHSPLGHRLIWLRRRT